MSRQTIRVVSAEIRQGARYLLTQRLPTAVLPGLWEFPGGRVRDDESDAAALARTLDDRLGVQADVHDLLMEVQHDYDDWSVVLAVYRCTVDDTPTAQRVAAVAWVAPDDFHRYPFPGADQKTVAELLFGAG